MNNFKTLGLATAAALLLVAGQALATPTTFDFANGTTNNTDPGHSRTVNGVTATGWSGTNFADISDMGATNSTDLWQRNQTNDHGLGVCSEGSDSCKSDGGDVNELDDFGSYEGIALTKPSGTDWTSLWVSSLDDGDADNNEQGTLLWFSGGNWHAFWFSFNNIDPAREGDLFAIDSSLNPNADTIWFVAGTCRIGNVANIAPSCNPSNTDGEDNDYLVWKGAYETVGVPEPGALAMFGLGLFGLGFFLLRRTRRI